jgi:hypothetical protein
MRQPLKEGCHFAVNAHLSRELLRLRLDCIHWPDACLSFRLSKNISLRAELSEE